jgi:tRNA A-37 threonylcarbamoyl transferase component Bud32
VDKVITNDAKAIKSTGAFSEAIYVVVVNPKYLTEGHTKTNYVIKKNKWFSENMKITKRDQNTPAKELIDLKKVQAYIVPKLSTARYAKIATIGNSLFYLDKKGAKQYFVVLEAADGRTVFDLFDAYAKDSHNQEKWDKIMFNVGRAVGELHQALSDQKGNKGVAQDFRTIKDFSDFKTIPHGDLHMQNIFYDEGNETVTFIDTGSMADTLKSKGSPVTDLVRFFTFTKYLQKIHYDFNKINRDLVRFADGYSKGFTGNEATQKKVEEFVLEYFKYFSTEYGKALNLALNGTNPEMQPTLLPIIKFFFKSAPYSWPLIMNVFYDDFVSKEVKEPILPHLVKTHQIQEPVGRAIVEKARQASSSWPLQYVDLYADYYHNLSKSTGSSK